MHDIREEYSVWRCYEIGSPPFYCDLLISIYLALLQIVGIVLAFQTRKVKIRVLSDSKFVAALVYISSIVLVVIVLTTFILRSYSTSTSLLLYSLEELLPLQPFSYTNVHTKGKTHIIYCMSTTSVP